MGMWKGPRLEATMGSWKEGLLVNWKGLQWERSMGAMLVDQLAVQTAGRSEKWTEA